MNKYKITIELDENDVLENWNGGTYCLSDNELRELFSKVKDDFTICKHCDKMLEKTEIPYKCPYCEQTIN